MTNVPWYPITVRAAAAALFAAGLAATPIAATAQSGGQDGAAEEFVGSEDPTSDVGGNLEPGMGSGEKYTVNTDSADFDRYRTAAEEGDVEEAGQALADASGDQEITTDYVVFVNEDLGLVTVLTPEEIADSANES